MTKKEEMPKNNKKDREQASDDLPFNPEITSHDKSILNNQSQDEKKGEYFKERGEPIDYEGNDLDIPKEVDQKFNPTRNEPQDVEKERRSKESANSNNNIESQSDTVYKGKEAEKYQDPSKNKKK